MALGRKTGGRRPGSLNKTTVEVKSVLLKAFEEIGGLSNLVEWGKANPTEFYKLWGKLIPAEIKNADGEAFKLQLIEQIVEPDANNEGTESR